jgi:hypothetical protein
VSGGPPGSAPAPGPPKLAPFGLVLHRDGRWTHEGFPILHPKLRAAFDRGVRFLPEEGVYVVQVGRFRGQIEVEESAFFVRAVDLARGTLALSDGSQDALDPATLSVSAADGALVCHVKHALAPGGLPARFTPAAQAELLAGVEDGPFGPALRVAGELRALPAL